jgi:hypothetical protein
MTRHCIHAFRMPVLAVAALLLAAGQVTAADTTLVCESQNEQYQSCPVNTSGGVHLSRQLSRQGCWQNDTWGYDRNRVWVTRGCRAEFRVGSRSSDNNTGAKVAGALVLGTIAAIAIAKHNEDKRDDRRDRYDDDRYDHRYNDGYDYGYGDGYYGGGANWGREFTCSSKDSRMTWCGQRVGRSEHVEVRRQLSNTPCTYGRTWGVDRNQVWTDQGCRAVFVVY